LHWQQACLLTGHEVVRVYRKWMLWEWIVASTFLKKA
jgi:hypothetical protein